MKKSKIILGTVIVIFFTLLIAASVFFSLDDNSQVKRNVMSTVKHLSGTIVTQGRNGNVHWELDDDGVLTINAVSGTDGMFDDWGTDDNLLPFTGIDTYAVKKVVFTSSVKTNGTCYGLFKEMRNLTEIENLTYLDTSNSINSAQMFFRCEKLTSVDLTGMETSNVLDMSNMFGFCYRLQTINWNKTKFNTSSVQNMARMFYHCRAIEFDENAFSGFNTSNVISMGGMFNYCGKIGKLNLTSFNTANTTNMDSMFWGCTGIDVDLSSFDTRNATNNGSTNSMLCDVKNFKLGTYTVFNTARFGSLPRGTFRKDGDILYSTYEIYRLMSGTDHVGRYEKVSNISKNMTVDFTTNYKILDANTFDSLTVYESDGTVAQDPIFKRRNGIIYMDLGNISNITTNPTYNQKAVILLKNKAVDVDGNYYDMKLTISNVELRDMVATNMDYQKEILIIGNNSIELSNNSYSDIDNQIGHSDHQYCNGGNEGISESVKIELLNDDGTPVNPGSYIFSAYDIDIPSTRDNGYGYNSEGINLGNGLDRDLVKFSEDTFLQKLDWNGIKRITGTRTDAGTEMSEFLTKADAQSSEFTWTAGITCGTDILTNYQPKSVGFAKTYSNVDVVGDDTDDNDRTSLAGATLELYYANDLTTPKETWTTDGTVKTFFLNPGQYILKEKVTPNGYYQAEDIVFYVDTNDKIKIDGNNLDNSIYTIDGQPVDNNTIIMNDEKQTKTITIHKEDEEGNPLQGAQFEIIHAYQETGSAGNNRTLQRYDENNPYYFEKVNGVYQSNNKERSGTAAVSFDCVDLTDKDDFVYIVNASIDSQEGHDFGYVAIYDATPASGSGSASGSASASASESGEGTASNPWEDENVQILFKISGNVPSYNYQTVLEGGKQYLIFYVYAKDGSISEGSGDDLEKRDRFIINSVNTSDEYRTYNVTTNASGVATQQISSQGGIVSVRETNAPAHYYMLNDQAIENSADRDLEFTFKNRRMPQLIVHHYLKQSDGTYTTNKVAPDEESEAMPGTSYTTSAKSNLAGLIREQSGGADVTPANANGTYVDGVTEVTYYYEVQPITLTINHVLDGTSDTLANQEVITTIPAITFPTDGTYSLANSLTYDLDANNNYATLTNGHYDFVKVQNASSGTQYNISNDLSYSSDTEITYSYNLKNYGYTVEYYYDGVIDPTKTDSLSAAYGSEITTYTDKNIPGHVLDTTSGVPLTITDDPTQNIIKVYYVRTNYNYSVEYYYDNVKDNNATETGSALFGSEIDTYIDKCTTGYRLDTVDNLPLIITDDDSINVIKVYYVTRTDLSYIVNYLEKGTNNVIATQKEATNVTYGDTIYAADEVISITGYTYDSADKASITISTTVADNVLNLYYTKNAASVVVHHKEQTTENTLAPDVTINGYYGDNYTTTVSSEVPSKYVVVSDTPADYTGTMGTSVIEVTYYYTLKDTSVLVHHYIQQKDGTQTEVRVPSNVEGQVVQDVTYNGKVDDPYQTSAASNVSSIYELVGTPANASGTMTEAQIVVNYYYQLKDYGYSVEYYYDNVIDNSKTESGTATYGDQITTYTDKNITGYKLDSVSGLPLTISETASNNVIKVYYVKDSFNYTVEYYYDNVKNDNATETLSALYGSEISTYPNKCTAGYELDHVDTIPLTVTEVAANNVIKVYYVTRTDLSYIVNYLEKDTGNVINPQKVATNVTYGDTINATDEVISIYGYNYDSADKSSITISETIADNVINLYYTKKDAKVTARYLEQGTDLVIANPIEQNGKVGDAYTTAVSADVPSKYELVATPSNATGTMTEQDIEVIYYFTVKDTSVLVHHYILSKDGTHTTTRVPSDVEGVEVADVTINGKVDSAYEAHAAGNIASIYELAETPANASGTMLETQIVVNFYYQLKDYGYSVEYYYDNVKDDSKTESGTATYGDQITTYTDKNITGYKLDSTSGLPLTITDNVSTNVIKIYYVKDSFGYTIEYYYDNVKDDSKTVNDTAEYQSQISTYPNKCITGYALDHVDTIPLTISEIAANNVIKVYYVTRTDLSYIVNYLEKDTGNVVSPQKSATDVTYGTTINAADEVITITGYNYDSADKASITISETAADNVINLYYTKKDVKVTTRYLEETTENVLDTAVENTYKYGDSYTTSPSSNIPSKYELVATPANASGTLGDQDVVVTYYYRLKDTSVLVHHYIQDKQGNKTQNRVPSNIEGETVADVTINGKVDQAYQTSAASNVSSIYELVETPDNASGTMTETQIVVNYYYQLKDYGYSVEYYYDNVKDDSKTESGTATYGDVISTYTNKIITGYKLDHVDTVPLTITDNVNTNVIKVYYVKDSYGYTVEYYYDGVIDNNKTVSSTAIYGDVINTYTDKNIDGYRFDHVDTIPLTITEVDENNVIKVYYVKRADLSYIVNYLEKDTDNVISDQKYVENVTYGNTITSANEVITITGYNYDSADKESITISHTVSENVINLYYTKKDTKVIVKHLEENTENELAQEVTINGKFGDSYTTTKSSDVPSKYEVVSETPAGYTGTMTEQDIVVTYYYRVKDASVLVHHYIMDKEGNKTTNRVPSNVEGETVQDVTLTGKVDDTYQTSAAGNIASIYELAETPENASGTMTEDQIEVNYYYRLKDYGYTVEYYYDGDIDNTKTENGTATYGDEISTYTDKNIPGFKLDSTAGLPLTITDNTEANVIKVYYVRDNFAYTVEYYYGGVKDENATESGTALYGSEINTYIDKVKEGYVFDRVDEIPFIITEDPEINVIKVYYKNMENLVYTVNYLEKGTGKVIRTAKIAGNVSYNDIIRAVDEIISIYGYEYDSADKESITITVNESENVINLYYTQKDGKVTVRHLEDGTDNVLAPEEEITGKVGDEYTTNPSSDVPARYAVVSSTPDDYRGEIAEDEIVVTYYYALRDIPVTVHYYIEDNDGNKTTNKVPLNNGETATDIEWIKKPGETYTSNALTNPSDKYELVEVPENQNGTVPDTGSVEVIYYYKLKPAKVTTHYYIQDESGSLTTDKVPSNVEGEEVQDVVINGRVDDAYQTTAATNVSDKYELVATPTNATGTMTVEDIDVTYYYALKNSKVTAKYIDRATNTPIADEEIKNGKVDDPYTTTEKTVDGYTYISNSGNTTGIMTVDDIVVTYYYAKNTNVVVRYLEKDTDEVLANEENIAGYEGKEYETELKDVNNYTCVEVDGSTSGTMRRDTITVTYYYLQQTSARVEYIDRSDNHVMEWREQTGLVGDEFVTEAKTYEGYVLVESPEVTTVAMTKEPITLKYYYEPLVSAELIERHINSATGAIIESTVHNDKAIGDTYSIESKTFEGYDLDETKLPTNAQGTISEETTVVDYYYLRKTSVTVHYIDQATGEKLSADVVIKGHENDPYVTESKTINNYTLVGAEGNTEGNMTVTTDEHGNVITNIEVTYYYKKEATIIVNHIDDVSGIKLVTETKKGLEGEAYTTSAKSFEHYDVVTEKLPANASGTFTRNEQVVNYYYKAKVTVVAEYISGSTGERVALEDRQEGHEGDTYTTTAKDITGYKMVQVIGESAGVMKPVVYKDGTVGYEIKVIYVYRIPITVVVDYIDKETGKKITTSTTIEGYDGDLYTTSEKEVDGYELIETPDNANGIMEMKVVDDKETTEIHVKYLYAKKATGTLPQTSENYGNKGLFAAAFISNIALAGIIFKKLRKEDKE